MSEGIATARVEGRNVLLNARLLYCDGPTCDGVVGADMPSRWLEVRRHGIEQVGDPFSTYRHFCSYDCLSAKLEELRT